MDELLIRFRLLGEEARALRELAAREDRRPVDQVRHIVRRDLEYAGLLQPDAPEPCADKAREAP